MGPTGVQGPTGAQGPTGPQGTGVRIIGTYNSYDELKMNHSSGNNPGDGYLVNGILYVYNSLQTILMLLVEFKVLKVFKDLQEKKENKVLKV